MWSCISGSLEQQILLPRNLTWNLKMMVSKRNLLFQGLLVRFHVKFQGCIYKISKAAYLRNNKRCSQTPSDKLSKYMDVSKNSGTPKWMVYDLWWKTLLKWMIWGYQNFLEHPYIATTSEPHQPGDSIRDQTWSPNVGLVTIRQFLNGSPFQKGHQQNCQGWFPFIFLFSGYLENIGYRKVPFFYSTGLLFLAGFKLIGNERSQTFFFAASYVI